MRQDLLYTSTVHVPQEPLSLGARVLASCEMRHSNTTRAISPNTVELDRLSGKGVDENKDDGRENVVYPSAEIPVLGDAEQCSVSASDELCEPSSKWPLTKRLLSWGVELRGEACSVVSVIASVFGSDLFVIFMLRNSPCSCGATGRDPV
jgi:hypothetical protein